MLPIHLKRPYLSFGEALTLVETYGVAWVMLVIFTILSCTEWFPLFQCVDVSWWLVGWIVLGLGTVIFMIFHSEW